MKGEHQDAQTILDQGKKNHLGCNPESAPSADTSYLLWAHSTGAGSSVGPSMLTKADSTTFLRQPSLFLVYAYGEVSHSNGPNTFLSHKMSLSESGQGPF